MVMPPGTVFKEVGNPVRESPEVPRRELGLGDSVRNMLTGGNTEIAKLEREGRKTETKIMEREPLLGGLKTFHLKGRTTETSEKITTMCQDNHWYRSTHPKKGKNRHLLKCREIKGQRIGLEMMAVGRYWLKVSLKALAGEGEEGDRLLQLRVPGQ